MNQRLDARLYDGVYDNSPNSLITMTYIEDELASTVRVHVIADEAAVSPALDVFPDVLAPRLKGRRVIVDPPRLAARRHRQELSGIAVLRRPPAVDGGAPIQRRLHRCEPQWDMWGITAERSGPRHGRDLRSYPKVTAKAVCVGLEFAAERDGGEARYPSFRSTPAEREALFGGFSSSLAPAAAANGRVPARADAERASA